MKRFFELQTPLFAPKEDDEAAGGGKGNDKDDEVVLEDDEEDEKSDDESEDDKKEDDEEEDLPEDEKKHAIALFKMLKDPESSAQVIEVLAKKAGLKLSSEGDKKDDKKTVKKAKDILLAKLGDKYEFLSDAMGSALDEYMEQIREELKGEVTSLKTDNQQTAVDRVLDKIAGETKGASRKFESKMAQLAREFTPAAGVSTEKYVRNLYAMAISQSGASSARKDLMDRVNRNSNDVGSRLRSAGGGGQKEKKLSKTASLDEIVAFSYEQVQNKKDK